MPQQQDQEDREDREDQETREPPRHSIWSVTAGEQAAYFCLFIITFVAGTAALLSLRLLADDTQDPKGLAEYMLLHLVALAGGAAGVSLAIMEAPNTVMVVARYLTDKLLNPQRNKLRQEGLKKGLEQGRNETNGPRTGPQRQGLRTGPRTGPQRDQRPVGTVARPHEESPRSRPTLRRTTPKPPLNQQGPPP